LKSILPSREGSLIESLDLFLKSTEYARSQTAPVPPCTTVTLEQTFVNRRDENVSLDCFDHIAAVLECIRSQLGIQLGVQREKFKHIMMERSISGSAGVRFVIDTQRTREWRPSKPNFRTLLILNSVIRIEKGSVCMKPRCTESFGRSPSYHRALMGIGRSSAPSDSRPPALFGGRPMKRGSDPKRFPQIVW
jgi:hypothetical protein